ncbi:MAG TPA: GntP family permease [Nocardioidaceae bacterium]|nr:GntP family permease [Nocardioidaceae bacterium]
MDTPMDPAYSTGIMLLIAAVAVALLLLMIIQLKVHAFISLVLVSILTAIATRIPLADIPDALMFGFAGTLGEVALLVAFGAMLGKLLEVTGGAQVLADTLIARFGEKRAPLALGVASLLFGFPIFFDAGLVVFLPIIFVVARRFGGSLLLYALPAAGAFAAMHALVPPHPGPVAAAEPLGAPIGLLLLVGVLVAIPTWFVGSYLFATWVGSRVFVATPAFIGDDPLEHDEDGPPTSRRRPGGTGGGGDPAGGQATATRAPEAGPEVHPPSFGTVVGLLLIPFVLISLDTVLGTLGTAGVISEDAGWVSALQLIGQTPVALLITVIVAIAALRRGRRMGEVDHLLNSSLGPIAAIVLITGAGGMFGGVLELSGIGASLATSMRDIGVSVIVAAFLISTALRVSQGSATVALTTAAGLIAPAAERANLGDFHQVLLVVAIAAGATVLSHVNDSGFWLVSRFFGMDVKTTLKTWTVMETTLGLTAFAISLVLWYVF